jgi:hypothetical protein
MFQPEPIEEKKPSSVWKWIGLGCGGILLVCIGLGVGLIYLAQRYVSVDSEKAQKTAQSIMDYKIPGGSRGLMEMNIAGMKFVGVTSASNPNETMLMIGQMPKELSTDTTEFNKSFEESFKQQTGQRFQSSKERQESKTLCGQTVNVTISEGEMMSWKEGSNVPAVSYQALVNHKDRLLLVQLTTSGKDAQSNAVEIFNSLKCK